MFDLETDPHEVTNLGGNPEYADQIARLEAMQYKWARQRHSRVTVSSERVEKMTTNKEPPGILVGFANRAEADAGGIIFPLHVDE